MYSILHLEGGLGKHVAATAVAECIKKNHPDRKLIVVCAYPEVFLNLPFVHRVYRIGNTPYFYDDYIDNKDFLMFKHEPYFTTDHLKKAMPLTENWCKLYNLEYNGEKPSLIFNARQQEIAINKWRRDKPIIVMQTNGGPLQDQPYPYSWTRDMPRRVGQDLVYKLMNDFHIIQICRNEGQFLDGAEHVNVPLSNMELFGLLGMSTKRILIDSSLQHAAAAMNLPSTVLWVATSPTIFGYELHNNIIADFPRDQVKLPDSYIFDYNFNGETHECPLLDYNIFNAEEILKTL